MNFQFSIFNFQIITGLVFYGIMGLFLTGQVEAATQTLKVSPVIINIGLSPDKTYNKEVTVENLTDAPMPLKASFNDFITSGEEGGYVFEKSRTNPLISWSKLDSTEFILNPKEKKKLQLTIKTPKQISLGGYYSILFFEPVLQNAQPNATLVNSKVGILMLANVGVPDPNAEKAEILTFTLPSISQDGNLPILLRVKNVSLNFFTAKPILKISPLVNIGNNTKEYTLEDKIIFPGKIRRWEEASTIQNLSPNIYKAAMAVSTGDGSYVNTESYVLVLPYAKVFGIGLVLLLVLFLIIKRNRLKHALKALISK